MLFIGNIGRALEHHVFKEVGKPGAPDLFTVGTHVVGHIHVHQRIGMVLVQDHGQAVGQPVLGVGNGDTAVIALEFLDQGDAGRQGRVVQPLQWQFRAGFVIAGRQREQQNQG